MKSQILTLKKTFLVSISGGQLSKELEKTYGERGLDYFYAIDMDIGKEVGPSWEIFSTYKESSEKNVIREFRYYNSYIDKILSKVDLIQLLLRILYQAEKQGKDEIIFLCYEKPNEFCHRFILAEEIRYITAGKGPRKVFWGQKTKKRFGAYDSALRAVLIVHRFFIC